MRENRLAGGIAGRSSAGRHVRAGVIAFTALVLVQTLWSGVSRESRLMRAAVRRIERHFNAHTTSADSAILRAYRQGGFRPLFVRTRLTDSGKAMLDVLEEAWDEGIDPSAYDLVTVRDALDRLKDVDLSPERRGEAAARADLTLVTGFSRYARDMLRGANDPSSVQKAWHIVDTDTSDFVIDRILRGEEPASIIEAEKPASPQYAALVDVLKELRRIALKGGWPQIGVIADSAAANARSLRARLAAGDDIREQQLASRADADGAGSAVLDSALASFQRRHGLAGTGKLDDATIAALNVPVEDRIRQTGIALERWRWMPRRLGSDVLIVNVPEYVLRFWEGGRQSFSMEVIVGRPGWETALFSSTLDRIVVNPYWNVPESILREDLVADLRDDPHALERKGFDVVDRHGKVVDPADVDWSRALEGDHPLFRLRQKPGARNALGYIKFLMPNKYHIYLHDTPADDLFARTDRALSHGCIRVARPAQLARSLLAATGSADPDLIEPVMKSRETRSIDMKSTVNVYLAYFTVWVEADGRTRYLRDVYGLDERFDGRIAGVRPRRRTDRRRVAVSAGEVPG